ncbi:MAG: hypothetical protein ACP5JJ_19820, partial [Anaerolineae bacterium]
AVSLLLDWHPDLALVGGPPLYLSKLPPEQRQAARANAKRLASRIDTLILDHHLLRCEEGLCWLDTLSAETGQRVICAADFLDRPRCLLEAWRVQLYKEMPVSPGWHAAYARGEASPERWQNYQEGCIGYDRAKVEVLTHG